MSAAKHTPGPWTYFYKSKYDEHHVSIPMDGTKLRLALFPDGCPSDQPEADARLIAAAPRMSDVLKRAAHILAELPDQSPQMLALRTEIVDCIKEATPEHYGVQT